MRITSRRSPVDIPHLFCPVEEGSNLGGDRDPPNVPKTPFMRERERERERESGTQRERNGEEREREWGAMEKERREGERERGQERGHERERGREWERDPQSKSRGLTGAKGGWWVRADQGVWDAMAAQSR